ncbi:RHS repeat-associated core domain-containing protein [Bacillus cereus group sp. TH208-1LC]|uniref:RHS repeat-associated core domain-containing protein n=1 Tax=Bacillus pacificus TaxID=2026187 RepID=UPI000AE8D4F1|nr:MULTISPECIES: RHS repeat-associated core domain-containing protein [Bacillus cereus group]MDA1607106.1 RHS repeat-associated core domain-containing protein [Bacillus cereus group sp. TH208-1LC]MED1650080.1 RHS repeat-associated core domain-containing protein [Bacillus pacificus]
MTDQNREVVATYEYDSWGNVLKSDAKGIAADNPFGYAGYMYDKEIGMYYLIARYYNPEHGVFLSVDPDPGDEDDPITMNGYTYGDNNPVMMVDPDGHAAWWIAGALGGAAWDVGTYLWKNHKKGYSWKGVGKSALRGAVTGVALGGVGRVGYFATKLKYSTHAKEHLANPARQMSKSAAVLVRSFGRKHIDKRNPHDRFVQTLGEKHIVVSKTKKITLLL